MMPTPSLCQTDIKGTQPRPTYRCRGLTDPAPTSMPNMILLLRLGGSTRKEYRRIHTLYLWGLPGRAPAPASAPSTSHPCGISRTRS